MYKSKRDRLGDRGSSPISKRSRSSLGRYNDDSDEDKGRGRSSPGGRGFGSGRERDYYENTRYKDGGHHSSSTSSHRPYQYKVLCISSLHARASDEVIREAIYREFKRFGEISVKVVHEPDERVAYVYFRSYEDARDAKHSKSRIMIYEKPVMIEAAYESTSTSNSNYSRPPQDSYGPDRSGGGYSSSGGYNRRSPHPQPPPPSYERGYRDDHRPGVGYDRYHGPPPHHANGPPPHFMRNDEYTRRPDPRDYNPGRPHPPPMYPPRNERYYDNNYPPPRYHPGPPPRGPPMQPPPHEQRPPYENKKDKFPNYLHHVAPEDDPLATRTLFAGNLEVNISDDEMRRIFGRYGTVEDIDIKRPPPGTGNAFAFVRFANLDMAARAKSELSGQYIGKFQCKIGYGKVNPTTKIWVGGLGPWATMHILEREFDRFGSIKKIDWEKGDQQCFITYETIDAAQAAVKDMRGYALGGPDKRIRTDFAGVEQVVSYASRYEEKQAEFGNRNRTASGNGSSANNVTGNDDPPQSNFDVQSSDNAESGSEAESSSERRKLDASKNGSSGVSISLAKTVSDISKRETIGWQGSLILKNSSFPTKFYLIDGDLAAVNILLKDEEGKDKLRITQRLRLDQSKLDDVTKRIETSSGYGIFLGWPSSSLSPVSSPSVGSASPIQSRPLKNLVSYLKQKEAAGVISLANKAVDLTGVLYAFPPCPYSLELLQKSCPEIEESKEDYLLIVVIRGGIA